MKTIAHSLAICLLLVSNLFAGTIHPLNNDENYIKHGKNFPYVLKLCGSYKDNSLFCASAVAIDKHWIITAAHVVNNSKICILKNDDTDKTFAIKEIICHPDFNDNSFGKADLALGYIENDIGLDFYPTLYETDDEIGNICDIAGYGLTGNFETGCVKSDNLRRAGSNLIEYIDRDLLICTPSNFQRTNLEFVICSGDSGGGLFIQNKLAGINSCVLAIDKKPNSDYGDEAGHTRISKYIEWIKKNMDNKKHNLKNVFGVDK